MLRRFAALLALCCLFTPAYAADYAISGRVTEFDGSTAVAAANVRLVSYIGFNLIVIADTSSDAQGHYSLAGSCSGICRIRVTSTPHFLVEQELPASPAGPLALSFALERPSSIAGHVGSGGSPVAPLQLKLYRDDGSDFVDYGSTYSNAAGDYVFGRIRPGRYRVCAYPDDAGAPRVQCFDGYDRPARLADQQYDEIDLDSGEDRDDVHFDLSAGRTIAGSIRNAFTGQPSFALVELFDADGVLLGQFGADEAGNYRSAGLAPGTYLARARTAFDTPFIADSGQLYGGILCHETCDFTAGTPIVVGADKDVTQIDFSLMPRAIVRGIVRDAATQAPLAGVPVTMLRLLGIGIPSNVTTHTAADGSYALYASPGQSFRLHTPGIGDYAGLVWPTLPCPVSCDYTGGTPITLADNSNVTGYDFDLVHGGRIAGLLFGSDGQPLHDHVYLTLYSAQTGAELWTHGATYAGSYETPYIVPGTYYLAADGWDGCQVYLGHACPGSGPVSIGTPIVVVAGSSTSGIDFTLRQDALFSDDFEP